jgi:dihydropteroate synthase
LAAKDSLFYPKKTLNLNGKILDLSTPRVMGILNITPDSFYDGGRYNHGRDMLRQAAKLIEEGADIVDIGACSSRPGAPAVSEQTEWQRLKPALKDIQKMFPGTPLSVDTFRASIAEKAVAEGAAMVNDVSGGSLDPAMFEVAGRLKVPYVLMHMRGTPENMQKHTRYDDLLTNIFDALQKKYHILTQSGVTDVIIDVGFGFAKTIAQNFELLRNLGRFSLLGAPILAGLSRKSLIWKTLGRTPAEALNGTTVLNTLALDYGADILRVHDVQEAWEAIALLRKVQKCDTAV